MNNKNNHCVSCNRTYSGRSEYNRHLVRFHNMKNQESKQEDTDKKV